MQTVLVLCHAVQRLQTAVSYQTEKAASTLKQLVAPAINTGKSNAHAPVFQQHLLNTLEHGAPAHTSDMTRKNVTLHVGNRRPSDSHLAQTAGQYFQGQRRSRCHARHQPQVKTNQLYLTASCQSPASWFHASQQLVQQHRAGTSLSAQIQHADASPQGTAPLTGQSSEPAGRRHSSTRQTASHNCSTDATAVHTKQPAKTAYSS